MNIALLGFGTVGSHFYKLCEGRTDLHVAAVLSRRPRPELTCTVTADYDEIVRDPSIDIVVEVMGGIEPAYSYLCAAMRAGKHVVTANKQLMCAHFEELTSLAKEKGVALRCTAAAGGGIPWLTSLSRASELDEIKAVEGILNGTTNYMLSAMTNSGADYAPALRKAQELGYAEADPTADVEGIDAGRKICILADLCFGKNVPPSSITTEGITKITPADIECARALGYKIKLLGRAMRTGPNSVTAFVAPHLISRSAPLANVDGVMNGISVRGDAVGEAMFFGPGAGSLPTASAVAADIIDCVRDPKTRTYTGWWPSEPGYVTAPDKISCRWMVRTNSPLADIAAAFSGVRFINAPNAAPDEYAFVTGYMSGEELKAKTAGMSVLAKYRVLD